MSLLLSRVFSPRILSDVIDSQTFICVNRGVCVCACSVYGMVQGGMEVSLGIKYCDANENPVLVCLFQVTYNRGTLN